MKRPDRRQFLHLAASATALPAVSRVAQAQTYPDRPVRVVVPYAPGGPTDVITRLVAQKLSDRSGKQFYVENIGGGGGNVAMGRVAKMAPDGYTLLMVNPSYVVNPTLYRERSLSIRTGFRFGFTRGPDHLGDYGPPVGAGSEPQRPHHADQSQPQKIQLCVTRNRDAGASGRRGFSAFAGLGPGACALQQRWIGSERRARRPYARFASPRRRRRPSR